MKEIDTNNLDGLKILIFGVNGFIGSHLAARLLKHSKCEIYGMDICNNKLSEDVYKDNRFHFTEGDITINKEWVEYHIKKCDVIVPLVAVANPTVYVKNPLYVFQLDFEANHNLIKMCVAHKKRLIFPSTSEVYGMCPDEEFNEETSVLVQGPINKERWIYSTCKQLLDRVIYAYGHSAGLRFTIFRPFNWVGPKLDDVYSQKHGASRVVSQFIGNIIHGKDLQLVDGGAQRRCFTYIDDAMDALMLILSKEKEADGKIFNIGSPQNDAPVKEIAEKIFAIAKIYPKYASVVDKIKITSINHSEYYGSNYQDVKFRKPSISNIMNCLGWQPKTNLNDTIKLTAEYYFSK